MTVINDQMVSYYANYLLGRVGQDDEAPLTPSPGVAGMAGLTGTFRLIDSDGIPLEVTVRPAPQPAGAVVAEDPEAWVYL